ncbi:MAG: hypothetical protein JSS30_07525 [Verrucomicrobia bacterium]|nr:hypothetical protein [Verrucomicrobiota bacterium]
MSADLLQLVTDTLAFLGRDLQKKNQPVSQKPVILPPKQSMPLQPKEATPPPPAQLKKELSPLLDKIKKHLPQLHLVPTTPVMRRVAIVVANPEDIPFLSNLKNAIEKFHCPVKMLEKDVENWEQFELVISQRDLPAKRKILLESIATYQNNTEQKKLLWSTICQHLSPKSS